MQDGYRNKMASPAFSGCRECGGSGEIVEKVKTKAGTVRVKHVCPTCGGNRKGYRTK